MQLGWAHLCAPGLLEAQAHICSGAIARHVIWGDGVCWVSASSYAKGGECPHITGLSWMGNQETYVGSLAPTPGHVAWVQPCMWFHFFMAPASLVYFQWADLLLLWSVHSVLVLRPLPPRYKYIWRDDRKPSTGISVHHIIIEIAWTSDCPNIVPRIVLTLLR